jgi:hypothetical protein
MFGIEFGGREVNLSGMRWLFLAWVIGLGFAASAHAAEGHVFKVLPQFLDQKGREALTPSLYDRDAYQAHLRLSPTNISTLRFAVQWKESRPKTDERKLRVEVRGAEKGGLPSQATLELPLPKRHAFSHWDYVVFDPDRYKAFGEVTAWRVTLWDGDRMLAEQKSFLW